MQDDLETSNRSLSLNASIHSIHQANPISFPLFIDTTISFHQGAKNYNLILEATEERLDITLQERFDVNMWRGEYTSKYIEEVCRKTGKARTYQQFLQLLINAVQNNQKGSTHVFLDLLGIQDLQLLKQQQSRGPNQQQPLQEQTPKQQLGGGKQYLIVTHCVPEKDLKVHYPLSLNPIEPGSTQMLDKQTMQKMVKRMSQTITEFKAMSQTQQNRGKDNNGLGGMGINQVGRQTAKEFFSKENISHPVVEENQLLKQKLKFLEEARTMGGAVSVSSLQNEKGRVEQEFNSYKTLIQQEIKRLKAAKQELTLCISEAKQEIQSERPQSAYSQLQFNPLQQQNQNMSATSQSGFTVTTEIEELRRQLAESSVELEDLKEQNKKKLAFQEKDIEELYGDLGQYNQEEKQLRVKVKQLENDLSLQIKRLDIICKTKNLPRPNRKKIDELLGGSAQKRSTGGSYVSPYRQGSTGKSPLNNTGGSNERNKYSPFRNNYTPPNRKYGTGYSPSSNYSGGSKGTTNNKFASPKDTIGLRKVGGSRDQSPAAKSNNSNNSFSKKSNSSSNRLYSPSGRVRNEGGTGYHGYNKAGVNRVRREPAVVGSQSANSRSNSRSKETGGRQPINNVASSRTNNQVVGSVYSSKYGGGRGGSLSKKQSSVGIESKTRGVLTTAAGQEFVQSNVNRPTLFGGQSNSQIAASNIDDKIEKLQSLLKMAKQGNQF